MSLGIASDIFYTLVFFVEFIILSSQLLKARLTTTYINHRLGNIDVKLQNSILIHCVSVGELMSCKSFIGLFKKRFPGKIVITTSTVTGYTLAKKIFSDLYAFFFPMDFSFSVRRFLSKIKPEAIILMETELWPNLVLHAKKQNIKLFVVNGRISDKAYGRYLFIQKIMERTLSVFDGIFVQTEEYAKRVISLGAKKSVVFISGSMKFDLEDAVEDFDLQSLRSEYHFKESEKIWVCGSTHWPEEKFVIESLKNLRNTHKNLKLIIAPRHFNKLHKIEKFAKEQNFRAVLKSDLNPDLHSDFDIIIVNQIGELRKLYGIADIVFVGGSLINHGGQNILEPTIFSKPVIFGPFIQNFKEAADELLKNNGGILVNSPQELEKTIDLFLKDEKFAKRVGRNAYNFILKNRGNSYKMFLSIMNFLNERRTQ